MGNEGITDVVEGQYYQVDSIDQTFNKIIEENLAPAKERHIDKEAHSTTQTGSEKKLPTTHPSLKD